ncbi:MAG: hypothetical protein EAY75_13215 [Bacteroidetes bacterium]|nr:MAG: hypothetical protein EAY75_13215 [Bacteroidota bacterium]
MNYSIKNRTKIYAATIVVVIAALLSSSKLLAQLISPALLTAHFTDTKTSTNIPLWTKGKTSVWIFISPECPMCQNYAPTLKALKKAFENKVQFIGIIPGRAYTQTEIERYRKTYKIDFPVVVDSAFAISSKIKATVTPEVFVINETGQLAYRGAIDNWLYDLGKKRRAPTQHFLKDALAAVVAGQSVTKSKTTAKGCLINDF